MRRTTRKRPSAVPLEGHRPAVDSQGELHLLDLPSVEKAPPGTLVWYEQQLADLERALPEAKPGELASLHRRMMQYAERIAQMRDAQRPEEVLTSEQMIDKLTSEAAQMADAYLEVFVREYCGRHRLSVVRQ
jgi:hypothetical protein